MFLRPFLILNGHFKPKGLRPEEHSLNMKEQKKEGEEKNSSATQS